MSTTRKDYQRETITWEETKDPEYPYSAKVNQDIYLIRLNDFPDESLYTLMINNEEIEDLEDWPDRWIISTKSMDTDRLPSEGLSNIESEVLRLILSGKNVREIAEMLSLSDTTIRTYKARIRERMRMRTSGELTH